MLTIEALSCSGAGHIQTVSLNIPLQATDGISSSDRLKGEVFGSKHGKLFFRSGHVSKKKATGSLDLGSMGRRKA